MHHSLRQLSSQCGVRRSGSFGVPSMRELLIATASSNNMTLLVHRRSINEDLFEGPLDLKAGERNARKGPPVAHSLPVYKTTHKLHQSARWKKANLITNVAGGSDYRLRETQGEGGFDENGMYRDWLYGDERRYANYVALLLGSVAIGLFWYTLRAMGTETWDIPAPVLAAQRRKLARTQVTSESESSSIDNAKASEAAAVGGVNKTGTRAENEDALAMLKRPAVLSRAASEHLQYEVN